MKKLIIFLIRRKLGLKKYQSFQFAGQKNKKDLYWFEDNCLMKEEYIDDNTISFKPSNVSLNWLLNDECDILIASEFDMS